MALAYFLFGVSWIVVTDYAVFSFVDDSQTVALLQTTKGWVFVGLSSLFLYGLVWAGSQRLRAMNARLDQALRQLSILHRLLRHNLRNNCTIIHGHVELLEDRLDDPTGDSLETIKTEITDLVELSDKTHYLRELVLGSSPMEGVDLVEQVDEVIELMEGRYPDAAIEADLPPDLAGDVDPTLRRALIELVENAIEHTDRADPAVHVGLRRGPSGGFEVSVGDAGPGMPEMERDVLREGHETPMFHSQGLGLWIVRTVIDELDGTFEILDNEPRGTVVTISLP